MESLVTPQAELDEPTHEPDRIVPKVVRASSPRYLRVAWSLVAAGLAATVALIVGYGWSQSELRRAEQEIKVGQVGTGRVRLTRLSKLGLGSVESDYWLGICAEAEGRADAALAKWAGIPVDSSWYVNATLRRAHLALEQGRFAVVEEALEHASFPRGSPAFKIREQQLQHVYFFCGRSDDLRRRKHAEWTSAKNKAEVLRTHWQIDEPKAAPLRVIESRLEEVGRLAPDDDRVWLGRANLAIRTARFAEADAWLKQCLARRPEDPAVWRARLEWATNSDRLAEAVEAMSHLPVDRIEPEQLLSFRAWLAAYYGDDRAEQAALTQLLDRVPGDTKALSRLTELAVRAGQTDQAAQLRRRKNELDRVWDDYRRFLYTEVPTGHYDELGRLAETLGRWFEARGWWTLAGRDSARAVEAREALARLDSIERALASIGDSGRAENPTQPGGNATHVRSVISEHRTTGKSALAPRLLTVADALADIVPRHRAASPPPSVVPIFRDDSQSTGLHFIYENDLTPLWRMPEMMGGGVGLLDYDGDGWLDVYAVQGGTLANQSKPPPSAQRDRLFRNRGDGTFQDATASAGLAAMPGGYGHGVAVGDYDNDGRPDLFITRWRSYALCRNRGDGTFADVTAAAGLAGHRDWPTSAAFADLDGDGDLDLYVCHYSAWDPEHSPPCVDPSKPGKYVSCGPREFAAMPDHVFRNDDGRFVDVSDQSGVRAADRDGRGLGVVAADLDDDQRIDLFVANDRTANFLFRNRGDARFDETAAESGLAANADGAYLAGMGIACGDLDGDGRLDLAVTNFYGESTTFFQNLGAGQFSDHTEAVGLAAPSRFLLGFGATFFDANNDGWLDLATANGHVNDLSPNVPFTMPAQLLLGDARGRLTDVSLRAGAPWQVPRLGRGLAVGDLDNDGRLDLLIVAAGGPLAYFHNQGPSGHYVTVQLEGAVPGSSRDAIGARLILTAAGCRQVAQRLGGGSFLSASDGRLHFGLGEATHIEAIEVRWPSGHVDRYSDLAVDAAYLLRERQAQASPLRGWRR
jgi:enediyne biosynthesis protein E4